MFSQSDIISKSWLVREAVNLVLAPEMSVDRIYLVGSYASGRANDYSDVDFLVQLRGGKRALQYPIWSEMSEIKRRIDNKRIHVIYGTIEAQKSMYQKNQIKYAYKELQNANLNSPLFPKQASSM